MYVCTDQPVSDIFRKHVLMACLIRGKMCVWLLIALTFLRVLKINFYLFVPNGLFGILGRILEQPTSVYQLSLNVSAVLYLD